MKKILIITIPLIVLTAFITFLFIAPSDNLHIAEPLTPIIIDSPEYYTALSINDIIEMNAGQVSIEYSKCEYRKGMAEKIEGVFTTGLIFTPEDAVKALTSVRDIFDISSFSYAYTPGPDIYHQPCFELTQLHEGIEVIYGYFRIFASDEGIPKSIWGRYIDIGEINTEPSLSPKEASKSFAFNKDTNILETKLVIFGTNESDIILCWYFNMFGREVFVDAHTGVIVYDESTIDW